MASYHPRQTAYNLRKLRGKALIKRISGTRRYRVRRPGLHTLAGLLILRDKVLKPVLAGVARPQRGRPPKNIQLRMPITRTSNAKSWPPCRP